MNKYTPPIKDKEGRLSGISRTAYRQCDAGSSQAPKLLYVFRARKQAIRAKYTTARTEALVFLKTLKSQTPLRHAY